MSSHKNLNMTLLRAFVSFIAKREKGSMNVEMDIVGYSAMILQTQLTLNQSAFQCTGLQLLTCIKSFLNVFQFHLKLLSVFIVVGVA